MPKGKPFEKGKSGNPGGRPSTKWIRDFLAQKVPKAGPDMDRKLLVINALYTTSIDRAHKDHVKAGELLLAYEAGKPVQSVEFSGPDGAALNAPENMTSEQRNARFQELMRKAGAGDDEGSMADGRRKDGDE